MEANPVMRDLILPTARSKSSEQHAIARALLAEIAGQKCEGLAEFYGLFQRLLFSYFSRITADPILAEDLLIKLMLAVWQEASTYPEEEPVLIWLFKLAHRITMEALPVLEIKSKTNPGIKVPLQSKTASLKNLTSEEIGTVLAALNQDYREILILAFYQKFAYEEIADITGKSAEKVKDDLADSKQAIKGTLLAEEGPEISLDQAGECPAEFLGWYVTQALLPLEMARVELHLGQCQRCQQDLAAWLELQEAIFTTALLTPQSHHNLFETIGERLVQNEVVSAPLDTVSNEPETNPDPILPTQPSMADVQHDSDSKWWGTVKKQLFLRRARREL